MQIKITGQIDQENYSPCTKPDRMLPWWTTCSERTWPRPLAIRTAQRSRVVVTNQEPSNRILWLITRAGAKRLFSNKWTFNDYFGPVSTSRVVFIHWRTFNQLPIFFLAGSALRIRRLGLADQVSPASSQSEESDDGTRDHVLGIRRWVRSNKKVEFVSNQTLFRELRECWPPMVMTAYVHLCSGYWWF